MDWKREAKSDLRGYIRKKASIEAMEEKIRAIEYQKSAIKSSSGKSPTKGGGSRGEDRMINLICEQDRLKLNNLAVQILVESIERGLQGLSEPERKVLDRFYIYPVKNHVEHLMQELNYEKSSVYNLMNEALYNFTVSQYGLIDY